MNTSQLKFLNEQRARIEAIIEETHLAAVALADDKKALEDRAELAEGQFIRTGETGELDVIQAELSAVKTKLEAAERRLRVARTEHARINGEIGDATLLLADLKREKAGQLSEQIQEKLRVHRAALIEAYGYLGITGSLNSYERWKIYLYSVFDGPGDDELNEAIRNAEAAVEAAMSES